MGKKESVPKRQYTQEFKAEAVKLGMSIGGNAAAKRLGIPQSTMTNWIRLSKAGALPEPAGSSTRRPVSELEAENARLRRELADAKLDVEILKNRPRGLPRPIGAETRGGYTAATPGQWPLAFWRRRSPSKKPGSREAADPAVVAPCVTPFRKVICSESPSGVFNRQEVSMSSPKGSPAGLPVIHDRAAGVDVGSRFHVVFMPRFS